MKRFFNFSMSLLAITFLFLPMLLVALLVRLTSPGLTGWAQINGRDELPIPDKVEFDEYYLNNRCFALDLRIIFLTVVKVVKSEGVTH